MTQKSISAVKVMFLVHATAMTRTFSHDFGFDVSPRYVSRSVRVSEEKQTDDLHDYV